MYYVDSGPAKVYAFDFHTGRGGRKEREEGEEGEEQREGEAEIREQRVLIDCSLDRRLGKPDGMTLDW